MFKNKAVALLIGLCLLCAARAAFAEEANQEKTGPPAVKIGYVYAQRILEETIAGKKIKRELDELAKDKRASLDKMKDEILQLDEDLSKKRLVLSMEAKNKIEEDIRQKQIEMKRYQEDSLLALKKFEKEALKTINDTAMQIIKKIGEEEKYTLVLEVRESNVLYASPEIDLTDRVITEYNKLEMSE